MLSKLVCIVSLGQMFSVETTVAKKNLKSILRVAAMLIPIAFDPHGLTVPYADTPITYNTVQYLLVTALPWTEILL